MNTNLIGILIATSAALSSPMIEAAAYKQIQVKNAGETELTVGVWYPSDEAVPTEPNTEYGLAVAMDAPIKDANGALIVISHGYSGWYGGHADTAIALADAGYIVAAPSHAGNTWSDMSSPISKWMLDRPHQISQVIDHMLNSEPVAADVDPEKIGVYGFSAGGYTALALIGGILDFDQAQIHCSEHPREYVCAEGMIDAMLSAKLNELPSDAWGLDDRIKAAAIAAPGWAFAYPNASLTNVTADVQLWSGMLDERVPTATNAALLAKHLPTAPEEHWVQDANHFAFMVVPCRDAFKQADPVEYEVVCGDAPGFDRNAFHTDMHQEMKRFFGKSFGVGPR